MNPYRWLDLYSEEKRVEYAAAGPRRRGGGGDGEGEGSAETLPPHVYATSVRVVVRSWVELWLGLGFRG